jgi:hypothetical protein
MISNDVSNRINEQSISKPVVRCDKYLLDVLFIFDFSYVNENTPNNDANNVKLMKDKIVP